MDKELIDRAWRVLPAEFKEEVKKDYKMTTDNAAWDEAYNCALEETFGTHNLTSDAEEEKPKTPKTWSELIVDKKSPTLAIELKPVHDGNYQNYHYEESIWSGSTIEKSALALLKIHQLIEAGYGGNVTNEEWESSINSIYWIKTDGDSFSIKTKYDYPFCHIAFHTKEQAEEFLKYPENVQLLKDYFML